MVNNELKKGAENIFKIQFIARYLRSKINSKMILFEDFAKKEFYIKYKLKI